MRDSSFRLDVPNHIGTALDGRSVLWCPKQASNLNVVSIGESGSGKTWIIQQLISRYHQSGRVTTHILDIKGDYDLLTMRNNGVILDDSDVVTLDYSYAGGNASINFLKFSKTKEAGGVFMAVQEVIEIFKKFNPQFGQKMIGYAEQILYQLYEKFGIVHEDESSWANPEPNVLDLLEHVDEIIVKLTMGVDEDIVSKIYDMRRKIAGLPKRIDAAAADGRSTSGMEQELDSLKGDIIVAFEEYVNMNCKGKRGTYTGWDLQTVIRIKETVQKMINSQLFYRKDCGYEGQRAKRNVINRYLLAGLAPTHQQAMMNLIMRGVYNFSISETRRNGNYNEGIPRHIIVADEGKHVKAISSSPLDPLNRIGTEGRGIGLGVILGVQSPQQITEDLLGNFGARFISYIAEAHRQKTQQLFGVTSAELKSIKIKESCYFSSGNQKIIMRQFV